MRIRTGFALSLSTLFVAVLVGCSASPGGGSTDADADNGVEVGATDAPVASGTPGMFTNPDGTQIDCRELLATYTADDTMVGVVDGTHLTTDELITQVKELFGSEADPVLSLLRPGTCAVLNRVSDVKDTAWNILIPGLDTDSAEKAAFEMGMAHIASGPGAEVYRHANNTPDTPRYIIYSGRATAELGIPGAVMLGLEILKPLASAIKTADIADLNGTFCPDKKCAASWEIAMPVLTNNTGVRTLTSQLALVGEDSGCLHVQIDGNSDRILVYCPAGVPTPAGQGYFVMGDSESRDRVWEATPGGPGTDAYLRQ